MRRWLVVLALSCAIFAGAGCPKPDGYTAALVASHPELERVVGLAWVPGSATTAVAVSQDGVLWRMDMSAPERRPEVYLDISDRLLPEMETEEGLLGLAFAPDFVSSGRLYVHYTAPGDEQLGRTSPPRKSVIARFRGDERSADPSSFVPILEVQDPFPNHNGGALVFGPDGYLYVSLGDGGSGGDPLGNAQRLDTLFGKIHRIDVSGERYRVPFDNPFVGVTNARGEIWAYGFRNPWRLSFDRATGALWTGDVGQGAIEEVDVVVRGGNYGWNTLEGSRCFGASVCDRSGTIAPMAEYTHAEGCSVTGGYVYRGSMMPELDGWFVYGDYCSGQVWGIAADGGPDAEPIRLAETGLRISSFGESPSGEIYIAGYGSGIYQLVRK